MATTTTSIELETLHPMQSLSISENAMTAIAGPASASIGIAAVETDAREQQPGFLTLQKRRSLIVITQLAGINFMTSFTNGLLIVGLPSIAADLALAQKLLLWPSSVFALTNGSCLLLGGSFADVIGSRTVNLVGCFFVAIFTLASGFPRSGIELIMFRALQGIGSALTFPSSIAIISNSIESGRRRNIGFATLGLAMPLGFSFGLVLGGALVVGPGWRVGFYIGGAVSFLLFMIGIWALPAGLKSESEIPVLRRLTKEIDWIGACMASTSLATFSYFLATLSANVENVKKARNVVLLMMSLLLAPLFVMWMHRQEKLGKAALIPNSIWKKKAFTSICIMVLLVSAVVNCMELFSSLFFQEVQGLSALEASLRLLPNMILGIAINALTGYFVDKVPAIYAVLIASGLCAIAPVLMAVIDPKWPYWYDAFFAQLLSPLAADILFTVGILIVSDSFGGSTQALAGAVFNTLAQLGTSIGLTSTSLISVVVTLDSEKKSKSSPAALMEGYRASFWTLFAWMVAACVVGGFGLRKLGKIGEKRD